MNVFLFVSKQSWLKAIELTQKWGKFSDCGGRGQMAIYLCSWLHGSRLTKGQRKQIVALQNQS